MGSSIGVRASGDSGTHYSRLGPAGHTSRRPDKRSSSSIYRPTIDRDGLPGDEIAVARGEEDERPDEVLRDFVAADRPALNHRPPRLLDMRAVLQDRVAHH